MEFIHVEQRVRRRSSSGFQPVSTSFLRRRWEAPSWLTDVPFEMYNPATQFDPQIAVNQSNACLLRVGEVLCIARNLPNSNYKQWLIPYFKMKLLTKLLALKSWIDISGACFWDWIKDKVEDAGD